MTGYTTAVHLMTRCIMPLHARYNEDPAALAKHLAPFLEQARRAGVKFSLHDLALHLRVQDSEAAPALLILDAYRAVDIYVSVSRNNRIIAVRAVGASLPLIPTDGTMIVAQVVGNEHLDYLLPPTPAESTAQAMDILLVQLQEFSLLSAVERIQQAARMATEVAGVSDAIQCAGADQQSLQDTVARWFAQSIRGESPQ